MMSVAMCCLSNAALDLTSMTASSFGGGAGGCCNNWQLRLPLPPFAGDAATNANNKTRHFFSLNRNSDPLQDSGYNFRKHQQQQR